MVTPMTAENTRQIGLSQSTTTQWRSATDQFLDSRCSFEAHACRSLVVSSSDASLRHIPTGRTIYFDMANIPHVFGCFSRRAAWPMSRRSTAWN